jgi:hypothetical protein
MGRLGKRQRTALIAFAVVAAETLAMKLRGDRIGRDVIVRCKAGHLYSTIWIPGASVKSLRLGRRRFQRCPVGEHWSMVTPVKESELSAEEIRSAHQHRDVRLP